MNDDAILSSLGVPLATPFNWGNEPQCSASAVEPNSLSATPSGLDSLVHFVKEDGGSSDVNVGGASDDAKLKNVLKSLLANAKVPLTTASLLPESTANSKRYEELMKTNDIFSRDVSIRGRSDRACAELTVASKSSLFGSILRIFDMTESDLKMAADTKKVAPSGSPPSGVAPFLPFSSPAAVEEVNDSMIAKAPILSTAEIVRSCHLTASPGDIHIEGNHSKEAWDMMRKTLPTMPLLKATNPDVSLELRSYGRVRPLIESGKMDRKETPDSMDLDNDFRRKVLNLERIFCSSLPFASETVPSKKQSPEMTFIFQKYMPRRKLCPHIGEGGFKEELTLMISGHLQQNSQHFKAETIKKQEGTTEGVSDVVRAAAAASSPPNNSGGVGGGTSPKRKSVDCPGSLPKKKKLSDADD
ncbi:predicted protein [Thalassiosira pseudonana CCMP1335]|uniref:Uncharacterized protein n=1 Tax=Thalassiosira pseudonana TaxID=35128 RepID=B8C1V3_THAPS|nr:predicted protein [Thalassiosira pseudonana CCMP1335]EED91830.1 predicted protein [Thalassiosira pseudonana CCMP1335]